MRLHILKTNISTRENLERIRPLLNNNPVIFGWTIDLHDIDKVLRIEAIDDLPQDLFIHLVRCQGFYCEELEG